MQQNDKVECLLDYNYISFLSVPEFVYFLTNARALTFRNSIKQKRAQSKPGNKQAKTECVWVYDFIVIVFDFGGCLAVASSVFHGNDENFWVEKLLKTEM